MKMRKAFVLLEMLAVIAVIAVMSIAFAALTRPLIIEIPAANRLIEANASVMNMLSHLRDDIESAVQLPDSFGDLKTDDASLLIELPDCIVCYTLEKDKMVRQVLKGGKAGRKPDVWTVPKAKIAWRRWQKDGKSYAVEVDTHFEYKQGKRIETKLANSHVYFVGASAEAVRKK
jgi:prepilin-type N-terminal cleavage/methylation domain-containing protein